MRQKAIPWCVTVAAALFLLFGYHCPFYAFVGIPCPACGLTRAFLLALQGNFLLAFAMHPFFYVLSGYLLAVFYQRFVRRQALTLIASQLLLLAFALVVIYLIRMAAFFPHHAPMVPNYGAPVIRCAAQKMIN